MTDADVKVIEEQFRPMVKELRQALARERGGGSPLTREQYIDLDQRARMVESIEKIDINVRLLKRKP